MISQELWLLEQLSLFYSIQSNLFYFYQIKANDPNYSLSSSSSIPIINLPVISKSQELIGANTIVPTCFQNNISVRIINWFVTNFSKFHNTSITNNNSSTNNSSTNNSSTNNSNFFVLNQFGSAKSAFNKTLFDPYCRSNKIRIPISSISHLLPTTSTHPPFIITSIAQLNFFKWAISNNILQFIDLHFMSIFMDLKSRLPPQPVDQQKLQSHINKTKKNTHNYKREISINACHSVKFVSNISS